MTELSPQVTSWQSLEATLTAGTWTAVAWDFDGVLVNSEPLFLAVLAAECRELGHHDRWRLATNGLWRGRATRDLLAAMFQGTDVDVDDVLAAVVDRFEDSARTLSIDPAAAKLLGSLNQAGLKQCVVSNSGRPFVQRCISRAGLSTAITAVLSPTGTLRPKPSPDLYAAAAKLIGAPPEHRVAVEDSASGATAAHAASWGVIRVRLYV